MEIEGTWYTTAQAADKLGLSHDTIRSAIRLGTLKATLINPRLNVVTAEALDEYRREHLGRRGRPPRRQPAGVSTNHQPIVDEAEA